MQPIIVIPAFRRHESLKRLLVSVEQADYPVNDIEIIISLDGGYSKEVAEIAYSFMGRFQCGRVKVIEREKNIGLKEHILWCGDQSIIYGSVIVLEEDLIVDRYFYHYARAAALNYSDNINIACIALYSPCHNEFVDLSFVPMNNGTSGYFMQVACSWGQLWTSRQWQLFRNWLNDANEDSVLNCLKISSAIKKWPASSWKKYFSVFIAQHDFFVYYPYISYTTNCSDPGGTHIIDGTNKHQVPLSCSNRKIDNFDFPELDYNLSIYDSFMEPISNELLLALEFNRDDIEIDIYGSKPIKLLKKKKYVLTTKKVKVPIACYDLKFKPVEKIYLSQVRSVKNAQVYLAKSEDVLTDQLNFYQLALYYTGDNLLCKAFAKEYLKDVVNILLRKIKEAIS